MNRQRQSLILIAAIAIPAAAHPTFEPTAEGLCLASGAATYRIARDAPAAEFRIKIADDTARPDLRMQLVDRAEIADFVLVDDLSGQEPAPCRSATPIRTVTVDTDTAQPDVTVNLSANAGVSDYKIYVDSVRFSQRDAAALLAAMWKTDQRRDATGSIR